MSLLLLRRGDGWWAVLHWWEMLLYCGTVGVSEHTRPFLGSSSALTLMKGKNNFSNLCNCISFKFRQGHHRQASELSSMLFLTVSLMCWVWVFVIVSSEYSEMTDYFYMQRKKYTTARVVRVLKQSVLFIVVWDGSLIDLLSDTLLFSCLCTTIISFSSF